jgi:hypothetical protein
MAVSNRRYIPREHRPDVGHPRENNKPGDIQILNKIDCGLGILPEVFIVKGGMDRKDHTGRRRRAMLGPRKSALEVP